MYMGQLDHRSKEARVNSRSPNVMEPRGDVTNGATLSPKGQAYFHAYSHMSNPKLQAKKNINHISNLGLELWVLKFVLSIIAFSLISSTKQNNVVYNTFISYK
uniref:Uncharacterized protein n=2 Tax=Physcomitrium patens TaxID=3218 RepID=A0A2K1L457_PHYPA|nr:hypothetical protein PHYPA_003594 [Physcomitrium patens]